METTRILYCGAELTVPVVDGSALQFPFHQWDWPETYCGPGKLGDLLVPDTFPGGTHMMAICYIHDKWYGLLIEAGAGKEEFEECNEWFCKNMIAAVFAQIKDTSLVNSDDADLYRSITYYASVQAVVKKYWKGNDQAS